MPHALMSHLASHSHNRDTNRTARSWIEANFQKRECVKFVPSVKDPEKCCCGQSRITHPVVPGVEIGSPGDIWIAHKHTRPHPTDAYGTIEFQGGAHPTKAQYVRLAYDTRPELLVQLFTREWNLELPKLLITVQGGKANFELQTKLKKVLRKGLIKAAKTTGAWIFTGGTNTGVTKQVGDALSMEGQQRSGRVVSIGIAPWGIVERNHELLGHNRDVPCHSISSPRSKLAVLNNRHAYFLLVDNGTQGKYGAEIILRRKLEKYISNQKLQPFTHSCTPVVCLVIEGGMNTIRAVLEYVTDTPPVPVVVCDGSGRAADLIAFVHKYASDTGTEQTVLESMRDYLLSTIEKTFEVDTEKAECLYQELLQCCKNKNLITVFRIQDRPEGKLQELDQTILTALFKSQHLSPPEQLSLALTWNRVDIARSEIFVYGQEWPHGALDEAMMQALEHDRIDFVKLLLENGVSMKKFLTIPRLEELYNTKHGPGNTLGYILRDVRPHIPKGYCYTLHDVGLVINKLMGGAYRSYYTRRKFRPIYAKVMNSYVNTHRKPSTFQRTSGVNSMSLITGLLPFTSDMALFEFPFNELLIWAVLTKRQQMALLMWTHGEEALAKSLVACKLYKAMAHEAADDDLDTEIYEELRCYAKEFEQKGLKLLDFCYRQDAERAQRLLTCELHSWSSQSCLSLAVAANHRSILAHPCSQIILADLWMGALRTRKNTNLKVICGLLLPPIIAKLDFKSKEELQLMPQTEEEHLENQNMDYEEQEKLDPDAESALPTFARTSLKKLTKPKTSPVKVSLTDPDGNYYKDFLFEREMKQHRPLKLKKKLSEFYTAPITKFWADSMAYVFFLVLFTYTVLVRMGPTPSWQELYAISYITTLGCEKIREIASTEPVSLSHKFSVWAWNLWNPCDGAAILFFWIGLSLRLQSNSQDVGRVIYCVDSIYWYLRILNILGVNKYLGPLVTMMGKMVKNMIYFVVLLLVVLMSFGVARQSILFPNSEPDWRLIRDVYYQPYFMLYGEVFADDIDPPCGNDPHQRACVTGHWVTPIAMSMYLLIANILLINLLIAVFNNIFNEVNSVSHQVWMFQRFTVVMEYQQKPVLPPPFIAFCHLYSLVKYAIRKAKGLQQVRDNGLKLFLEKEDMERLYDFEEECVEGFFHELNLEISQSTQERIRNTDERVENMAQKIEDINQKENLQTQTVQNIEFRLRKVEEAADMIRNHMGVIHRFMSAHTNDLLTVGGSVGNLDPRIRTISETSDFPPRKKFGRSLTECHPDSYIFEDGLQFDMQLTVPEESEHQQSSIDVLDNPLVYPSTTSLQNLTANNEPNKERDRKYSIQSEDSDFFMPSQKTAIPGKPSVLTVTRQDTATSSESKDTLTPLDPAEDNNQKTLTGTTPVEDDVAAEIHHYDGIRQRAATGVRRRNNSLSQAAMRRNSESASNYDLNKSQTSLHLPIGMSRRQISLTQSEPDSGNEGAPTTRPRVSSKGKHMLLAFHTEYTSITDELESVCHMIVSPTQSLRDEKPLNELSNPEFAAMIETQHLKECEDNDYMMMERLLQTRCSIDEDDISPDDIEIVEISGRRILRRETAIELPITPSKTATDKQQEFVVKNERSQAPTTTTNQVTTSLSQQQRISPVSSQNSPRNSQYATFLNPCSTQDARLLFKKSSESLHKNSSTETDCSHPYKAIKQGSTETNTSLNSSFAIDNNSITNDMSLDHDSNHTTVIENPDTDPEKTPAMTKRTFSLGGTELRKDSKLNLLKKQFSMDQGQRPRSETYDSAVTPQRRPHVTTTTITTGTNICPTTLTSKLQILQESSSTSTEDAKDEINIPSISTNTVQDEIAKLSSEIKNTATEDNKEQSFNETMC
ncbi:transient receptor potential cation channel trpm isoform X3 [Culicoides brevitarsis]|uniref:transient receptor potential cation channel trpm isoform X3 n=1 Tax=Culicoides brevitarsis TaxID=469753 RepID=UPI00307B2C22